MNSAELRVADRSRSKCGIMRKVTELEDPANHPDLKRMTDCVNACAGIPHPEKLGEAISAASLAYKTWIEQWTRFQEAMGESPRFGLMDEAMDGVIEALAALGITEGRGE